MTTSNNRLPDESAMAAYFETFKDESIGVIYRVAPSVHKPRWCTCPQWLVMIYSDQLEAWVCCTCEGIVPDSVARGAK